MGAGVQSRHVPRLLSHGTQNACWTAYDGFSSGISNGDLQDIIDRGNPGDVEVGDRAYLDNGAKTDTLKYLRDKFYGCKSNGKDCGKPGSPAPAGADLYRPNPPHGPGDPPAPDIDSWVVTLPVFECQAGAHCSGGGASRSTAASASRSARSSRPRGTTMTPSR